MKAKLMRIARILKFFSESAQDIWLFLRHNGFSPFEARERRLSHKTIIEAHTVEKGLALPEPKAHFGRDKINALLDMNDGWTPPEGEVSRSMLVGALRDYRAAFADTPAPDPALAQRIATFLDTQQTEIARGGVRTGLNPAATGNAAAVDFLQNRFSARDFADLPLTDADLQEVVTLAQRAPSQCNRQSSRLHVYRDRAKIAQLLNLQGGARGFLDKVPTLFVVTSELTAWGGPQQRNQPYVDGGIYAMMLLMALDAKGFVSCPLNLAVGNRIERALKSAGDIASRERLVVMIAAGLPPDHAIRAARSPRWPADAVCRIHD